MAVTDKISTLVKNQFPDFYKEEGDKFLEFIQAYYEWMEENGNLTDSIRNLKSYRDISTTTDDYIQHFFNTLIPGIPTEIAADKRLFAKYVKHANISRGTLRSYNLLFRILFNESIDLYYPSESILKVSDGDWRIDRYLVSNFDDKTYKFIGKTIRGADSTAEALVEDVITRIVRGRHIMQILLSNVRGTFQHLERIYLKSDKNFTGHNTVIDAGINKLEVLSPGGEYKKGDILNLKSSIIGDLAKVVVTEIEDNSGALTFSIVSGGSGYVATDNAFGATTVDIIGETSGQRSNFEIYDDNIVDTFEISISSTLLSSNNVYGSLAPINSHIVPSVTPIDGTVTATASDNTITGVGTNFINDLQVGDKLFHHPLRKSKVYLGTVSSILNSTTLTTESPDANRNDVSGEKMYYERSLNLTLATHANTLLCAPDFGFRAAGETGTKRNYRDHEKAVLRVANTAEISVGDSLFGVTSGANCEVTAVADDTDGAAKLFVDGYRNFTSSETVRVNFADSESGTDVGAVTSFSGNTIGKHYISIANSAAVNINIGDEIVGITSNCYAVIKTVDPQPYAYTKDATSYTELSGTVTTSSDTETEVYTVNGDTTTFQTDFTIGDTIKIGELLRAVTQIVSDTELQVHAAFDPDITEASVYGKSGVMRTLCRCCISANSSANLTSIFDTGPILSRTIFVDKPISGTDEKNERFLLANNSNGFLENEALRFQGSSTHIANVEFSTGNTNYESIATPIGECLVYESSQFGTIAKISDVDSGSGYYNPAKVSVVNPDLVAFGIGEAYLTIHSEDANFGMDNSGILDSDGVYTIDTNDRLVQTSTGASGDVKGSNIVNTPPSVTYLEEDGVYEIKVRIWQDFLQRDPAGINWELGPVAIKAYDSTHITGNEDTREPIGNGTATIVDIVDGGVLGKNANIKSNVGANGTIVKVKSLDSGFNYGHLEECLVEQSGRPLGTNSRVKLYLKGVANSAGYYYSDRSHISTARGYITDSNYYQEYSYEIISPVSLKRYRDIALEAVHPAGNKLFGKFRNISNSTINIAATPAQNTSSSDSIIKKQIKSSGTASLLKTAITGTINITANTSSSDANNLFTIQGFGTDFENELSANSFIIIETDPGNGARNKFIKVQLNDIVDANTANLNMEWTYGNVTGANVYFDDGFRISGSSTDFENEFNDGDTIILRTESNNQYKFILNTVNSSTSANITTTLSGEDIIGADVYKIQGQD